LDKQALRPTIFNIEAFKKTENASPKTTDEEQHLFSLSKQKGWQIIVDFKQRVFKEMEEVNRTAMSSGLPFDEIGKNAVVINLAESIVERIINLVDDAKDACETTK